MYLLDVWPSHLKEMLMILTQTKINKVHVWLIMITAIKILDISLISSPLAADVMETILTHLKIEPLVFLAEHLKPPMLKQSKIVHLGIVLPSNNAFHVTTEQVHHPTKSHSTDPIHGENVSSNKLLLILTNVLPRLKKISADYVILTIT